MTSQTYIVLFAVLAWQLFRDRVYRRHAITVLALRYAFGSVLAHSFLGGFWMLANWNLAPIGDLPVRSGRYVGEGGDIVVLHALGFHALQALPLLVLLVTKSRMSVSIGRTLVHLSDGAWLATGLMIAWQTALGYDLVRATPVMLGFAALFAVWAGSAAVTTHLAGTAVRLADSPF